MLDRNSNHGLYIKWGRFQAAASGWPAVIVLATICIAAIQVYASLR